MKKNALLSSVLVLGMGLLVSCAKPGGGTPGGSAVQSSMSATINGTSWVATNFSGTNVSGTLEIEGGKADGSQFALSIPANATAGSYPAGGTNTYQAIYETGTTYSSLTTGKINISSNASNVISGTFSGTFTNTSTQAVTTVTNGVFTSTYQ